MLTVNEAVRSILRAGRVEGLFFSRAVASMRQVGRAAPLVTGVAALGLVMGAPASAQEQQTQVLELEEITVTGSRIKQSGDYASPTPLQTFDAEQMANLGLVSVSDAIIQQPANVSNLQPGNVGGTAFFVGSTLANLRGLNPFFGTRTLTLVDSRRHVATNQGGSVDLNFVPSILIDRMEIVTGGASAAYGSEAVTGVVNIILDKDLEGFKAESSYSASTHGDGDNWNIGLAAGTELFEGRGHIVFGAQFDKQDVVQSCADARDWCARGDGLLLNGGGFLPGTPASNQYLPGQPQNIVTTGLRRNQESYTGVIFNNDPNATIANQFSPDGTSLTNFNVGQFGGNFVGGSAIGGDGLPIYDNLTLIPEVERKVAFTHFKYDLTDNLSGFFEASFGKVEALNRQEAPFNNSVNLCIAPDNAFIQGNATLQNAINNALNNGVGSQVCMPDPVTNRQFATVTKNFAADIDQRVTTDTEVMRAVIGLEGRLGGTWTWDAYYQYGKTERDQLALDYRTNFRFRMAVDSVIDPVTNQPVCRVTLDPSALPFGADPSLANGCVPLNPFGVGNISPQAYAYAFGSLTEFNEIDQHVVAVNFTGELWDGIGAGPLMAATGLEYRKDSLDNTSGNLPLAQRTDFSLQYGNPFGGETEVAEAYLELEMPFLRDAPFAKQLLLNTAVRYASYETKGGIGTDGSKGSPDVTSWKVAAVWDPVEWLRVRASRSRDLRAPGFRELFYSQTVPAGAFFCPVQNLFLPNTGLFSQCANNASLSLTGDPTLRPEKADTITAGLVFSPGGWAQGMRFSADFYRIDLEDGISLGDPQEVVRRCFQENDPVECARLTFGTPTDPTNPRSNLIDVRNPYRNALPYKASGIDFAFDYNLPLSNLFETVPGSVLFRLTATRALETIVQSGTVVRDIAGQTGGDSGFAGISDFAAQPDWAANLIMTYMNGPMTFTTQVRYVSDGKLDLQTPKVAPGDPGYDPTLVGSVSDNTVPSYAVVNFAGTYKLPWTGGAEELQLFATLDNAFDKEPPFSAGNVGGVNAIYFDTLGRTYRLGARLRF